VSIASADHINNPTPGDMGFAADKLEQAIDDLANQGYAIIPDFISPQTCAALYQYTLGLTDNDWQLAGVGRADNYTTNTLVRRDRIRWLQAGVAEEQNYLQMMEAVRHAFNRALFMGLFDYECHLAHYPPGAFYRKHLDAFKGRSNRILTTVLYLNPEWHDQDGGELVIYGPQQEVLERVLPASGKLVVFLSDTFVHEVLEGFRDRYSITGWFRHNNSIGGHLDPTQ